MKRLREDSKALGLPLSAAQQASLEKFGDLIRIRAAPYGLVSSTDLPRLYDRHIRDSLRASAAFEDRDEEACDIGSGAGFPGIVLAIALPRCRFRLIESRRRAVAFLELAVAALDLRNAEVVARRVEDVDIRADVATARAYGSLERAWIAASRLLRPGGRLVYFAGERARNLEGRARLAAGTGASIVEVRRVLAPGGPLVIMTRM